MLTSNQEAKVLQAFKQAQANGGNVVAFWQDHFYTRNNRFGYPVCVQVQKGEQVEYSYILHWSSSKAICEDKVAAIDAYLSQLESEVAK